MANKIAKVELEFTLPKIGGVLNQVTMEVLEDFGEEAVKETKKDWTGWAYGRQYSPPLNPDFLTGLPSSSFMILPDLSFWISSQ